MNKKYFCSTTLPYANSRPHIGHAFEFVLADIISRYYRSKNFDVLFNVGIDEHGTKIQQAAIKENLPIQVYCDKYAPIWKDFCAVFQIDYSNFYRTTTITHKEKASEFFALLFQEEFKQSSSIKLIYEKDYEGYYCEGCEAFKTEKEIENGKCIIHQIEVKLTNEKNLFFNLHFFKDKIKDVLVDKTLSTELKNNIEELSEISITRKNVEWGVKFNYREFDIETKSFNDYSNQTIYVWAEALCNYFFAAGYDPFWWALNKPRTTSSFDEYWENSLIICGKDNLKFQAYILQALLLSHNLPQTKNVLVHGTILDKNGVKMSKTLGNVIDPIEQVSRFEISPMRYYLFFGLNTFENSSYSEQSLIDLWNADIVNGYGNLIARVLHLIDIYHKKEDRILISEDRVRTDWFSVLHSIETKLNNLFEEYNFSSFRNELNNFIFLMNKRINDEKPFEKDCENRWNILNDLYFGVKLVSKYYKLIIPAYADKIDRALENKKKEILFDRILN